MQAGSEDGTDMGSRNKQRNVGTQAVVMPKKKQQMLITGIFTIVFVLVLAIWWFFDMRSYVATVAGRRISTDEFKFYLTQQQRAVEESEGLTGADEATRTNFWKTPVDGEDPVQRVKNDALDNAKELKIQLIKAKEYGMSINEDIRQYVLETVVNPTKNEYEAVFGESSYSKYIEDMFGITLKDFIKVVENLTLADRFRIEYLKNNFTAPEYTDEEAKAVFDEQRLKFEDRTIRYIYFSSVSVAEDGTNTPLAEDALKTKQKLAADILSQIQAGGNMEELAKVHSEAPSVADDGGLVTTRYSDDPEIKELLDWAYAAKVNDVASVNTSTGIYIARVEAIAPFDDVKVEVKSVMVDEARNVFYFTALDGWMKEPAYNLIRKDSVLDSIKIIP